MYCLWKPTSLVFSFVWLCFAASIFCGLPCVANAWPPDGEAIRVPIRRDTGVSAADGERKGSNGGATRLKLKGHQEYILFDIDVAPLKGRRISGALLHVRSATPNTAPLMRVGVSTISSPWEEGTAQGYRAQTGSACFDHARCGQRDWAYPGGSPMDVVFGKGCALWRFSDCSPPDADGWQTCAVAPEVIAARVAGLSHGFCAADEVGHIWGCEDGEFQYHWFPNRFIYSRESWISGPWLEVWVDGEDAAPPAPIPAFDVRTEGLPAGQAMVTWTTPPDKGGGKTLGYQVAYRREGGSETELPRYLIPMAGETGQKVRMHIQDLPFRPKETIELAIRPVDDAGNVGSVFRKTIQVAGGHQIHVPDSEIKPFQPRSERPQAGPLRVSVVDALDKIDPVTGRLMPSQPKGYKGGNHLLDGREKRIRLFGARNETLFFQLNFEGMADNISVTYSFPGHKSLSPKIYQFAYVKVDDPGWGAGLPDPLIPLDRPFSIPTRAGKIAIPDQSHHSLICELYIPHHEPPGTKNGKVSIGVGGDRLVLDVDLTVWNFTLPNKLSFIPEMNAYGTVSPFKGYDYYRLAHEHRTCINRLPYGWHGLPEFAPEWDGETFDFSEWDQSVGPLLNGSAFKGLPRDGEPVDVLYLPFSENWPVNLFDHYRPSYWIEEAFSDAYRQELKTAFAAFAGHCETEGWFDTAFQFYLNNKIYYRKKFARSSAPWIFDEPVNTQDFWALRWYGLLWRAAVSGVVEEAKMWYRGDISYSQYGRNILWGVMDITYLGGNNDQKTRMAQDEAILWGKSYFSEYGTANAVEESNLQPVLWCLSAWSRGARGVLPWQTIGGETSWIKGEQTALFYPHDDGPMPSIRLKAFTRGQQDVEYLTLMREALDVPRFAVAEWLNGQLNLAQTLRKTSASDAGTSQFEGNSIIPLWQLRHRVGQLVSKKAPPYQRALVGWDLPKRDIDKSIDLGYVFPAPQVKSRTPDCDGFSPTSDINME